MTGVMVEAERGQRPVCLGTFGLREDSTVRAHLAWAALGDYRENHCAGVGAMPSTEHRPIWRLSR